MASSGCRARTRKISSALCLLAACGACTTQAPQTAPAPQAAATPQPAPAFEPGVELPDGQGRDILVASCLSCHNLGGLALFKGFYTRDSWRSLVLTMQSHGAEIDGREVDILADYLVLHFGPVSP